MNSKFTSFSIGALLLMLNHLSVGVQGRLSAPRIDQEQPSSVRSTRSTARSKRADSLQSIHDQPRLRLANAETSLKYERMAARLIVEVDNISNEDVTDAMAFYMERVAPISTPDVVWDVMAGGRHALLNGTEQVVNTIWANRMQREFSFHQISNVRVFQEDSSEEVVGVLVEFQMHVTILEDTYKDFFVRFSVHFNQDDLIDYCTANRFHVIDRGYGSEQTGV